MINRWINTTKLNVIDYVCFFTSYMFCIKRYKNKDDLIYCDRPFKNCLSISYYAVLPANIGFNLLVNLFSFS